MVNIVDEDKLAKLGRSDRPRKDTRLQVAINWWILGFMVAMGVVVVQTFTIRYYADLATSNLEIVYFKLYENGDSKRTLVPKKEYADYLPATINKALKDFVQFRFGVMPATIAHDYLAVGRFISSDLYRQFTDASEVGGFDAIGKAALIATNERNEDRVTLTHFRVDHYEAVNGKIANQPSRIMRTNIYYTKVTHSAAGALKNTEAKILKLQWRLVPKAELQALASSNLTLLDYNPVGVEVINYEELDNPEGLSVDQSEEKK